MAVYVVERRFAQRLELTSDEVRQELKVNEEIGVTWLYSFLTADAKKSYCVYEATDPERLLAHARALGMPADVIGEVARISPDMFA